MGIFEMSDDQAAKFRKQLADSVRPLVGGEDVVAVGAFRQGGFGGQLAAAQLSGAAAAVTALLRRKKAGGLPHNVLLAVTPTRVFAFAQKMGGRNHLAPKEQVAVWDRAGLCITTEKKLGLTNLTIESPAEGEKATLVPMGTVDDPVSLELVTVLADAHGVGQTVG